jgi:hypothetical protein
MIDLSFYDYIICAFSGGKDSFSSVLRLLESGADPSKIQLWHHDINGREGGRLKMDWPCTVSYCQAAADALGLPLYYSWKVGGFEREMLRENARTAPTRFEVPCGNVRQIGGNGGKLSTRRKFPQVSADLKVRWCSAYLKRDVCEAAIRNQPEIFDGARTLIVSGERAEESPGRARYKPFEPDHVDRRNGKRRLYVDRWRPVHAWPERDVWGILERHKIAPHPAYKLGWGRVSCMACIFGSDNQWASLNQIEAKTIKLIDAYEREFGVTIHRSLGVLERVARGTPYPHLNGNVRVALSDTYDEPIFVQDWKLPAGAFGDGAGPT